MREIYYCSLFKEIMYISFPASVIHVILWWPISVKTYESQLINDFFHEPQLTFKTKKVLSRANVRSSKQWAGNVHYLFEQTSDKKISWFGTRTFFIYSKQQSCHACRQSIDLNYTFKETIKIMIIIWKRDSFVPPIV